MASQASRLGLPPHPVSHTRIVPVPQAGIEIVPAPQAMERGPPAPMCATDAEARKFATAWWAENEPQVIAHTEGLYFRPDELYKLLEESGGKPASVKLLRLSWLLKRAVKLGRAKTDAERKKLALPRRQELEQQEPEAFLTVDEVRSLGRGHVGVWFETCCPSAAAVANKPLKVLSISHGWLSPHHPDPRGQQLVRFAAQVRREGRMYKGNCCFTYCTYALGCGMNHGCCCFVVPCVGQQCCHCTTHLPSGEFGVFYDYGSLHQKDERGERTPVEREAFATALDTMGVWYGHKLTTTFIMSELPEGWPERPEDTPYFPPGWLKAKGWPTFERAASSMVKPAGANSWRRIVDPQAAGDGLSAYREAPSHPRAFAARLGRTIFTNGKEDCELVAKLHADTLAGSFSRSPVLEYMSAMWTDEEAVQLAEVLPLALQAEVLNLWGNDMIGQRGLDALAEAIRAGAAPKLRRFRFHWGWGPKAGALRDACKQRGIKVL